MKETLEIWHLAIAIVVMLLGGAGLYGKFVKEDTLQKSDIEKLKEDNATIKEHFKGENERLHERIGKRDNVFRDFKKDIETYLDRRFEDLKDWIKTTNNK